MRVMFASVALATAAGCGGTAAHPSATVDPSPTGRAAATGPTTRSVSVADLNNGTATLIGPLGTPLGERTTIVGHPVPVAGRSTYWEVNVAHDLFAVTRVDGRPLDPPVEIELSPEGTLGPSPSAADRTFVGYQDGGFFFKPTWATKRLEQQFNRSFDVEFHVVRPNAETP